MTPKFEPYDNRLMDLESKMSRLLRYHRQNVWDDDVAKADRHTRALHRLKMSMTFRAMAYRNESEAAQRRSDALLRLYA